MASPQPSLLELFHEYSANNDDGTWLERARSVAEKMEAIRRGEQKLTDDFLEQLWTQQHYGAASISLGIIYKKDYPKYEQLCREITNMLIADPSQKALAKALDSWSTVGIERTPRALTRRVLVSSAPAEYPSIVMDKYVKELRDWLNKTYKLNVSGSTWEARSVSLRTAIISQGIPDNDPFLVNSFIWNLYVKYVQGKKHGDVKESDLEENDAHETIIDKPSALNTIYYGAPGTGKTYRARRVLRKYFESHSVDISQEEWLADLVREEKWYNVVAAALADLTKADRPELMKHPLLVAKYACMGGKEQTGRRVNSSLRTHMPSDWPTLQYARRGLPPILFGHEKGGVWHLLEGWEDSSPDAVALLQKYKAGKPSGSTNKERYKCITFHQSYSYEDFVEGIRPVLQSEEQDEQVEQGSSLGYYLHKGIFQCICDEARSDPAHDYALLIDEINRGNISKIFGELITLIEDSKREGEAEEIKVTLPYSSELFGIPKNLYIIGTMNTADRSLALLDTALRRRFDFHRIDPDPTLLNDKVIDGVELGRLLEVLNERIAALYDQDHMIGHSYFWNVQSLADLDNVFAKKILPLLEEYFFDDWEKIRLVLGDTQKTHLNKDGYCFLKSAENAKLFGEAFDQGSLPPRWVHNGDAFGNPDSYIGIYDLNKLTR